MPTRLTRAATGTAAAPLPNPFPSLSKSRYGVEFRAGQLAMLAGPPGAGKSMLAIVAALRWAKAGIPGLYFSADSDEDTMAARAAAHVTGHPTRDVEIILANGLFRDEYGARLRDLPLRFEYDTEPSIEDIGNACTAFLEVWGRYPGFVVVDNLMNVAGESDIEVQTQRKAMRDFHYLARKLKALTLVLHHTSEQNADHIITAPPRTAIHNKVTQLPTLVLTNANANGEMFVAVVKNRHGEADPLAKTPLSWLVDFSKVQIEDLTLGGQVFYGSRYS